VPVLANLEKGRRSNLSLNRDEIGKRLQKVQSQKMEMLRMLRMTPEDAQVGPYWETYARRWLDLKREERDLEVLLQAGSVARAS
jgi:hypothetical protein